MKEKVSFGNSWLLLPSFASLLITNGKELFPWISLQQVLPEWRLTSCELQSDKLQFYKTAKEQAASWKPIALKVTSLKPTNVRVVNPQVNDC